MAAGVGSALLDFGPAPGTGLASVVVSGQESIGAGASVEAWFMADETADYNSYEHRSIFPSRIGLTAGDVVEGSGFTIYAETELRLTGLVKCRWVWSS
jgi:hypothetical protein